MVMNFPQPSGTYPGSGPSPYGSVFKLRDVGKEIVDLFKEHLPGAVLAFDHVAEAMQMDARRVSQAIAAQASKLVIEDKFFVMEVGTKGRWEGIKEKVREIVESSEKPLIIAEVTQRYAGQERTSQGERYTVYAALCALLWKHVITQTSHKEGGLIYLAGRERAEPVEAETPDVADEKAADDGEGKHGIAQRVEERRAARHAGNVDTTEGEVEPAADEGSETTVEEDPNAGT